MSTELRGCVQWYKIVETIEHENILVCYVPGLWENNGVLSWPPCPKPDRTVMSAPDNTWYSYQCTVLKECETLEEAKELEKRYSKHRDSNSFRKAQAEKQNKRDHPVNSNENDPNLINVTDMVSKIDQTSRKAIDSNKNKENKSLPQTLSSKPPKIVPRYNKCHSGRIEKHLKKTESENKKIKITETVRSIEEKGSRSQAVIPETSEYHNNCTAKSSGTCDGNTANNVEEILSGTHTRPKLFDENRDYIMSFEKQYHTRYMTDQDNTKEAMEVENQDTSRENENTERTSSLVNAGSLMRVGQRSGNATVTASGNNDKENDTLSEQHKGSKSTKKHLTKYRKPASNF